MNATTTAARPQATSATRAEASPAVSAPVDPAPVPTPYLAPSRFDLAFNRVVRRLTRMGLSAWGSRELRVVGRTSGQVRSTVVNLLEVDGERYLVAPRGDTQWVRNLRAAGEAELCVGRRVEAVTAVELDDAVKPAVLRLYLARWAFEVGRFFEGVDADASDAELLAIAPRHPVFRLSPR